VVAGRFAAAGYSALAIDLVSEEGGTGQTLRWFGKFVAGPRSHRSK
jgi:dienelactone hydrolase